MKPWVSLIFVLASAGLAACQTTHERMLAEGYPPAFADGFEAGCSSGRQAAGALERFRKDVPRYLSDARYAGGWDDGFRQCQASEESAVLRAMSEDSRRDRQWRQHVDQAMGKALTQHRQ
ncbi:hypothetical protein [Pseudomonas sp. Marseille-Q8238]